MAKRKGLSKRLRFAIFSRDKFTCRYCGRQAGDVTLVIDHLIPVCKGGGNEESNLLTACSECNGGKGSFLLEEALPSEDARQKMLERLQEQREQMETAKIAIAVAEMRKELRQELINYMCEALGSNYIRTSTSGILESFANQYGIQRVFEWIDIASSRIPSKNETKICKYICGIRRNFIATMEVKPDA